MNTNRSLKTTILDIIKYWEVNIYEGDLSIDFSEAHERCWRCGYKSKLEKCHIIPHSLGGPDSPDNYVLLCRICHAEGPNIADKDFFWDWLKAHATNFYDTYWITRGMQEYELVYKKSIVKELVELSVSPDNIKLLLQEQTNKCSWHFGQPRMNPATIAGLFYMIVKGLKHKKIT